MCISRALRLISITKYSDSSLQRPQPYGTLSSTRLTKSVITNFMQTTPACDGTLLTC